MTIFIEVLYSDLHREKKSLDKLDDLTKNDVLFIMITTDQEEGKAGNMTFASGMDMYALCYKRDMSKDWIALIGFDDDYFVWRHDCTSCEDGKMIVNIPLACLYTIFYGVNVSDTVFEEAKAIFNSEMI